MDTVSLLLASPRGRRFCANVGYRCTDEGRAAPQQWLQSNDDVLGILEGVDIGAIPRLSEIELLDALGFATDFAWYWQPPDEVDLVFARPEVLAALRPIAQAFLTAPQASWWADPVDLDNQRVVVPFDRHRGWTGRPLVNRPATGHLERWRVDALATERRFREFYEKDPTSSLGGEWWSTPITGGTYATSRSRDGIGALELLLEEDSMGPELARVWPVRIDGVPRVYEITGPGEWAHLVDTYPLAVPASRRSDWYDTTGEHHDWFIPDWAAVAGDYDAVHLTMIGYLTTPGIAIPLTAHAGATVLAGWDPDATFWLRNDHLTVDDDPTEWRYSRDVWAWVPA